MSTLKKSQRRKHNQMLRRRAAARWLRRPGAMPKHIRAFQTEIEPNTGTACLEAIDRAPTHVLDHDAGCVDNDTMRDLSHHAGRSRTDGRDQTIAELRQEFPHLWGVRGKATELADEWFERSGVRIAMRTIQNYFQLTRR